MRTTLATLAVAATLVASNGATHNDRPRTVTQVTSHPSPARAHKLCRTENSTNCFHAFVSHEFPAWYAVTVPLSDGNDDLGKVTCHLYVRSKRHDTCVATGLFGGR